MSKEKNKKKPKKIENLNMGVNEFGELTTTINLDEINEFLNQSVVDKKIVDDKKEKDKKAK